ncbi:hypothetical protein [Cryptosporangium aurantiacum]|uniref:Hydroxyneurosporene synthase (CrtC) n=1 Tax=Cryptosporangium aurantiacum TaxID=134849 RepID=A0A1M7R4Y5_9ACTN|nr:hypothetical protein [Cryptosporangium aurantiacum]SHN40087.1 hypothetical protein SAMN05443668_106426 [Cryptosporangium aurantiacum]
MTNVLSDQVALSTARTDEAPSSSKFFYGDVTLCGGFRPTLADFDRLQPPPYGLNPLYQAWYGIVRSDSGLYYNVLRFNHVMMTPRLHLTRSDGESPAEDVAEARSSFYGYTSSDIQGDAWVVASRGKASRAMRFEAVPGADAHWTERGILDMRLSDPSGTALQMYHPDPDESFYYIGVVSILEGTILGEKVSGVGGYEQAWANGALDWREMPIARRLEEHWVLYVIEYADGGYEVASLYLNRAGTGTGHVATESGSSALHGLRSEFDRRPDGLPARIRWSHGDDEWEVRTETASTTSPRNPSYLWQLGGIRRIHDDRPVVRARAWCETLPRAYTAMGYQLPGRPH